MGILIGDSGATKTEWRIIDDQTGHVIWQGQSVGLHPLYLEVRAIAASLFECFNGVLEQQIAIDGIFFYGAGCGSEAAQLQMTKALTRVFSTRTECIRVDTDLLGAARSTFQQTPGNLAILGTGSAFCVYNGHEIEQMAPSLGFIIGDEGSGADLGRRLIKAYFSQQMPPSLTQKFNQAFPNFDRQELISRCYGTSAIPNAYCGSFAPFLEQNLADAFIQNLTYTAFSEFLAYIKPFIKGSTLAFVGSIAKYFEPQLTQALKSHQLGLLTVNASPIEGLCRYHTALANPKSL